MSSRNDRFECRWQRSTVLLTAYLAAQVLALASLSLLHIPLWAQWAGVALCLLHAGYCLPRSLLLTDKHAFTGLRRDSTGWQLWNEQGGWQSVQLRPDSMALPGLIVLRFRLMSGSKLTRWLTKSVCVPGDAMTPDTHRRLRLRLKFSRRRWAAPE